MLHSSLAVTLNSHSVALATENTVDSPQLLCKLQVVSYDEFVMRILLKFERMFIQIIYVIMI